jgi:hypothetical protein
MILLRVFAVGLLLLVGIQRLRYPALFTTDADFRVGARAADVAKAVGTPPGYTWSDRAEIDFWLKRGCQPEELRAISKVWIYERPPRQTVALGIDARGIVKCIDFSDTLIFLHV